MNGQPASSSPSQAKEERVVPKAVSQESTKKPVVVATKLVAQAAVPDVPPVVEKPKAEAPKAASPADSNDCLGKKFDHLTPEYHEKLKATYSQYADYKVQRLNEMACLWKGKKFEPYTVRLLSMLLVENGALDATVRGDYGYAFGLTQEHVCNRGLNMYYLGAGTGVKTYCSKAGIQKVEEQFPQFANDWVSQFFYFSNYISPLIDEGYKPNDIVHAWNRREVGRQGKVDKKEAFVKASLGL